MARKLSCKIRCFTHDLSQEAFDIFEQDGMNIGISNIKKDSFTLEFTDVLEPSLSDNSFASKSHSVFNLFIVALNVSTLGLFINQDDKQLSPDYHFYKDNKLVGGGLIIHDIHSTDLKGRNITQSEIYEALCLYGALAKEKNDELVSEYLKGLIHLSLNYPGAHFEKDAFSNFYRAFEHIVTCKLLKQGKLKNEFKQLSGALSSLGISQDLIEEFKELYKIRGEQAMHAQKSPEKISREDTMKMKVFSDIVVRAAYKPIWEEGMAHEKA